MATPLSLLSFRKNVTRVVKKDDNYNRGAVSDDDDDDNGWVHGGKYVPAPTVSAAKRQLQQQNQLATLSTPTAATTTAQDGMPSPYSMLSPLPLNTPLPPDTTTTQIPHATTNNNNNNNNSTPQTNSGAAVTKVRTPLTIQLQRLLQPTPRTATTIRTATNTPRTATTVRTTTNTPIAATPVNRTRNELQRGRQQPPSLPPPPATPVEKFLRESGVTPKLSHSLGNVAFRISSVVFAVIAFVLNGIGSQWNAFTTKYPHMASDIIESLFETFLEICQFVWNTAWLILPYLLWSIQILIALALTLAGTIVWALMILVRGREEADNSSAGEVHHSAVKSLKESVRNSSYSPFRKREGSSRLPFTGFSDPSMPSPQRVEIAPRPFDRTTVGDVGHDGASAASSQHFPPTNNRSATPGFGSAIRSNLKQRTPRDISSKTAAAATPASASGRRVLFTETEQGEVSTEQFEFDKHLPASARKIDHRRGGCSLEEEERRIEGEEKLGIRDRPGPRHRFTPPTPPLGRKHQNKVASTSSIAVSSAVSSSSSAAPLSRDTDDTILRPSKYFEQSNVNASEEKGAKTSRTNAVVVAKASFTTSTTVETKKVQPTILGGIQEEQLSAEEEERKKQQYIDRYGLLPAITPLSKRYRRMKHRQKQGGQPNATSINSASNATGNTSKSNNANRKRRGDLLGAASRLGRHRRARMGNRVINSSLPATFGNRTPLKRRRNEQALSRTDEWVWRAMNHDEKENRNNDYLQGSVAKRGKFGDNKNVGISNGSGNEVVSTPPKNPPTTALSHVMTPPKTPGPSKFAGAATPAPKKSNGFGSDITPTKEKPSFPSFSFRGGRDVAGGGATSAPSISFGGAHDASTGAKDGAATGGGTLGISFGAASSAGTENKNTMAPAGTAPGFSFGAPAAAMPPAAALKAAEGIGPQPAATTASTTFTGQSNEAASTSSSAAFSFGTTVPASAAGATFSFGATTSAATSTPAPISVGAPSQPTHAAPTAQPMQQPMPSSNSSAAFSFGSTAPAAGGMPVAPSAAAGAPSSTFSFGAGAAPPVAAATIQPMQQPAPPSNSSAAFSFGSTAPAAGGMPLVSTAAAGAPSSAFSFGAGAAPPVAAAPVGHSFNLGGSSSSGAGGASARRRAAKSGGRRR